MLNKPINPIPFNVAVNANEENKFECDVVTRDIKNSMFYFYDDNGSFVTNQSGNIDGANHKMSAVLPSGTLENGKDMSWQTAYWGDVPTNGGKSCILHDNVESGSTEIKVSTYIGWTGGIAYTNDTNFTTGGFDRIKSTYALFNTGVKTNTQKATELSSALETMQNIKGNEDVKIQVYLTRPSGIVQEYATAIYTGTTYVFDGYIYLETNLEVQIGKHESAHQIDSWHYVISIGDTAIGGNIVKCDDIIYKITKSEEIVGETIDSSYVTLTLSTPIITALTDASSIVTYNSSQIVYQESPQYYFRTRTKPTFSITKNDTLISNELIYNIDSYKHTFNIKYGTNISEDEKLIPLSHYQIDLYVYDETTGKRVLIDSTGKVYEPNNDFEYSYSGFISNKTYQLEITGQTIEDDYAEIVVYTISPLYIYSIGSKIGLNCENGNSCIIINPVLNSNTEECEVELFRRDLKEKKLKRVYIGDLTTTSMKISDYNVAANHQYQYYLFANINGAQFMGSTTTISPNIDNWNFIGLEKDLNSDNAYKVIPEQIWNFSLNVEPPSYKKNYDKTLHTNLGKYSTIGYGSKDYVDFSLSAYIGNINCSDGEYHDDIELVDRWEKLCVIPEQKLYKDPKGRIMLVDIMENEESEEYFCNGIPTTINCNVTQVGDTHNISITHIEYDGQIVKDSVIAE